MILNSLTSRQVCLGDLGQPGKVVRLVSVILDSLASRDACLGDLGQPGKVVRLVSVILDSLAKSCSFKLPKKQRLLKLTVDTRLTR